MTIVIDIGCAKYGGDFSIERLIEEFQPDVIYGFDPNPSIANAMPAVSARNMPDGSTQDDPDWIYRRIELQSKAAWIYDGEIGFEGAGLGGRITNDEAAPKVPCFDLAEFVFDLAIGKKHEIILKIDAEGAEYDLLDHLIETGADKLLKLAWVEWHPSGSTVNSYPDARREAIEEHISCELHQWNW